jgi:hypothetical protein
LFADGDRTIIAAPSLSALTLVGTHASTIVIATPHDFIDAFAAVLKPPTKRVRLFVVVRDARAESEICVLDEKIVRSYGSVRFSSSILSESFEIDGLLWLVGTIAFKFYNTCALGPSVTHKSPVTVSPVALVSVSVENFLAVHVLVGNYNPL